MKISKKKTRTPTKRTFEMSRDPVANMNIVNGLYESGAENDHLYDMLGHLRQYLMMMTQDKTLRTEFYRHFRGLRIEVRRNQRAAKVVNYYCRDTSPATRMRYIDVLEVARVRKWAPAVLVEHLDKEGINGLLRKFVPPKRPKAKQAAQSGRIRAAAKRGKLPKITAHANVKVNSFVLAIGYVRSGNYVYIGRYKTIRRSQAEALLKDRNFMPAGK